MNIAADSTMVVSTLSIAAMRWNQQMTLTTILLGNLSINEIRQNFSDIFIIVFSYLIVIIRRVVNMSCY